MKPVKFQTNGNAVIYVRVSSIRQARSGLGLQAQRDNCVAEARKLGLILIEDHWEENAAPSVGTFVDSESAYRKSFSEREAGGRVLEILKPGDTLIVSRLDRAFRNVKDFILISDMLTKQGVRLIVCYPKIDLGTAIGKAQAYFLAILAEWESARKGERISAALRVKANRELLKKSLPAEVHESLPSEYRPSQPEVAIDPTLKPGKIHFYIRCSHRDSTESGLGLIHQLDEARAFASRLIAENPRLELGEVFTDSSKSAWGFPLRDRHAGKLLNDAIRSGDHVVFSTLDRGFRNIKDMANTLPDWEKKGATVHFAGEGISMNDPGGRLMANVIVLFAQMESESASDRNKEARAQNAAKGKYCGGFQPNFWVVYKYRGTKRLVLDRNQMLAFRLISVLRFHGVPLQDALVRCEELFAKREKRKPIPLTGDWRPGPTPKGYTRDSKGRLFPRWTRDVWNNAKANYAEADRQWKAQAKLFREIRDLEDVSPPPTYPVNPRGWQQDGTTAFLGRPITPDELSAAWIRRKAAKE
jgi:DNA invertase Pin-like site-specific DNA recombinase